MTTPGRQPVAPGAGRISFGQGAHAVFATPGATVPAAHLLHALPRVEYVPGGASLQMYVALLLPLPAGCITALQVPGGQVCAAVTHAGLLPGMQGAAAMPAKAPAVAKYWKAHPVARLLTCAMQQCARVTVCGRWGCIVYARKRHPPAPVHAQPAAASNDQVICLGPFLHVIPLPGSLWCPAEQM